MNNKLNPLCDKQQETIHQPYLWRVLDIEVRQPLHVLVGRVLGAQIAVQDEQSVQDEGGEQQQDETDPGAVRGAHLGHGAALCENGRRIKIIKMTT